MEKFDIKTATLADLYAVRQYCFEVAETAHKICEFEDYKLRMMLCGDVSSEIRERLSPSIEEIKKKLSE